MPVLSIGFSFIALAVFSLAKKDTSCFCDINDAPNAIPIDPAPSIKIFIILPSII